VCCFRRAKADRHGGGSPNHFCASVLVSVAAGAQQPPAVALEVAAGVPLSWAEEAVEAEEHP
jgi:hypothetical protein